MKRTGRGRQSTMRAFSCAAVAVLTAASLAQMRVGLDGGALDASLGVNSGGFNRPIQAGSFSAPPSMSTARYVPGMTRTLYGFQSTGTPMSNPQIASSFVMQRYNPAGFSGWSGMPNPNFITPGWQYQYRYAWR